MESFYIDPHVHENNPILSSTGYDPYNTSQLFPVEDQVLTRPPACTFELPVVDTSIPLRSLFDSLTAQATLKRFKRYDYRRDPSLIG